jgi:hypothetical protein
VTRSVFRYVDYKTTLDPTGERTWRAVCVSGEERDCGAQSPELGGEEAANDWMAEHTKETGHGRFERNYKDYALVERQS